MDKLDNKKKIAIVSVVVLGLSCIGISRVLNSVTDEDKTVPTIDFEDLSLEGTAETEEKSILPDGWENDYNYISSPTGMTEKAKILCNINEDITGWISIENTPVNYPFLSDHIDESDEDYTPDSYYLDKGLDGEYLYQGTLFMDYRDIFGSDEDAQSENIVIFGHNMANDTMFGSLSYYRTSPSYYYAENPIIQLNSNYRDYQYVIFGFIITNGNWDSDFRYWDMEELDTEDDFNNYVNRIQQNSLLDTGVDVKYGDKLLTLSTCVSGTTRFIVVARRLRENETSVDDIDRTEAYIEEHGQEPETD